MKITVYRPNQIGGCVTEIESSSGTRIIIDVGSNLPGIGSEPVNVKELAKGCAGVFITHYHGDHIGEYKKIHEGTPVYIGRQAKEIFYTLQERLSKKSEYTKVEQSDLKTIQKFIPYGQGDIIDLGDLTITPVRADHSAYDSHMLLVSDGEKSVLHTGDFRTHGWAGETMTDSIKKYAGKVTALICEGTMLSRSSNRIYSENDLYEDAKKLLEDNRNVFVLCSSTNIDTIASFYRAAQETKRLVVADGYQRSVLDVVSENAENPLYVMKKVKVYWPNRQDCVEKMRSMGFCMFIRAKPVFADALKLFPGNLIVYSMWEGYLEENKPYSDTEKIDFLNWAKSDENVKSKVKCLHTSGHAYEEAIIELCDTIRPDIIFPIHSEKPDRFETLDSGSIRGKVTRLKDKVSVSI